MTVTVTVTGGFSTLMGETLPGIEDEDEDEYGDGNGNGNGAWTVGTPRLTIPSFMPPTDATRVLALVADAVWLVTSASPRARGGLVATFVSNASIVPELPRLTIGMANHHHTRGVIDESGVMALHLVDEGLVELVWRLGLRSGRDGDKLDGLELRTSAGGCPIVAAAPAWLDCRVEASLDVGDRTIYVVEVVDAGLVRRFTPLTVKRLLELATPERARELDEGLARDRKIDAAAIRAWRSRRS